MTYTETHKPNIVDKDEIPPPRQNVLPGSFAMLTPGKALLYECNSREEQDKMQSRLSVRCKKANDRSQELHFRTMRRVSVDGTLCVYVLCELKSEDIE